jgi:hypothetical protein
MNRHQPSSSRNCFLLPTAHRLLPTILVFLLSAFSLLPSAFAQSATATLSGTVEDTNGAVIPGVAITVTNTATALQRKTATNDTGYFIVPLLPPGTFIVRAERDGFAPVETQNVVLNVGDQKSLQIQLKAGSITEMVSIEGDAPLINESSAVSTIVDRQFVANMPLNGRSFQSLISLTPGVVFQGTAGNSPSTGGQFSVNGQRTNANYFTVDGVSANYGITTGALTFVGESGSGSLPGLTALGGTNSIVSVDALQEFKIQTSSYAPEFGRMPGGQISLLTRSGTNEYHGTLFDYLRNDVLDANDWFANRSGLPRAKNRQNDFGGVFGGPLPLPRFGEGGPSFHSGKDRTFFFFSYEGLRLRQPVTTIATVPSLQARQDAAAAVKPFFNGFPIPNLPVIGAGLAQFAASYSNPANLDAYSIRIDSSLSKKLMLFGTYKHSPSQTVARAGSLNSLVSTTHQNDALTLGITSLFSASVTNDLRFNWSRARATLLRSADSFGGAVVPDDSLLFTSPRTRNNSVFGWFARNSAGAFTSQINIGPGQNNLQQQLNLVDTLSWIKGNHQLKFGVDYRRISPHLNRSDSNSTVLIFNISPQPTLFQASLFSGELVDNIVVFNNFSAFAQDTWKASERLTLTYGLRWDLNPPPYSANEQHPAILIGAGGSAPATFASPDTPLYKTQYSAFAPRLGGSLLLTEKTGWENVLRGGIGLFYDLGTGVLASEFTSIYPYFASRRLNNISYPLTPAQASSPVPGVDISAQQFYLTDQNLKLPYTIQWNFAVEQSLGSSQSLTLSYVGSAGRKLLRFTSSRSTVAGFGATVIPYRFTNNDSRSEYRALQVQFQRRLSRGIQGLLSYTWGRSYDDSSSDNGSSGTGSLFLSSQINYAPSDFDVRHVLSGATTVDLPAIKGPRAINAVTKDWGLDAMLRFRTALPTTLSVLTTINGMLSENRPNVVPGVAQILFGVQFPGGKAINPAAFTNPPTNTIGNFPRNSLRFFNASQVDVALRRQFGLTERLKLQFRFEFFNIFNHPNFADPTGFTAGTNVSTQMLNRGLGGLNPLYQIGGPRSGQVGLKFIF